MELVLAFGLVLLISVSLSGVAARTVFSTSLLFLLAGALLGPGGFDLVAIDPQGSQVAVLADIALFTVLFTDGHRASLPSLRKAWRLTGRALGVGMPLTMIGIAVPAHYLAGLDWITALLVGAILAPTDPVFASALVGRTDVPMRLRRLLNVESGLNDGLALPFVLVFLATAAHEDSHIGEIAVELLLGLVFGIAIPMAVALAWRLKVLTAEPRLHALGPLAVAISLFAVCHLTHANPYLAAFVAGSTLATMDHTAAEQFEPFGELLSEITKFAALLVFGAMITVDRLSELSIGDWAVALITILLIRPAAMLVSLLRTSLTNKERAAAAWFGPKGFASVVYGLLVLQSGIPGSTEVFDLVTITIALSIALHSSTDVPVAKAFNVAPLDALPSGQPARDDLDDLDDEVAETDEVPGAGDADESRP